MGRRGRRTGAETRERILSHNTHVTTSKKLLNDLIIGVKWTLDQPTQDNDTTTSLERRDRKMKGRPLVETPGSGEAGADEEEEEDGFVGFRRHGMAVGRGRVLTPATAAAAPVLGTSPTAPGSAWSSAESEFHLSQFLHTQPTLFSILLRSERGCTVFRSEFGS